MLSPFHGARIGTLSSSASRTGPSKGRAQQRIVRSAICLQVGYLPSGMYWDSIGVLFRRFDCRTFWADCCAFLSRSRSSFNSEI
jgi:hypothetical protein